MCAIIEKIQKEVPIMSTNENKGKKTEVTALQAISAEDRKDWISLDRKSTRLNSSHRT